jgi:hypothetical protein
LLKWSNGEEGGKAMKTEAKSVKHRNEEGYAASLLRSCKPAIAFYFKKEDFCHTYGVYFCTSRVKTENQFIDDDKKSNILR